MTRSRSVEIMPQPGTCRLCKKERELQDSHFFPASIYKACRDAENNKNPIAIADGGAAQTSAQMTEYLLCADCERRLNENGERWIHLNIARIDGFPLQKAVAKATPILAGDEMAGYAGADIPEIDVEKLVYFGLSIFWRAAIHRWKTTDANKLTKRIWLGPYEEPIRRFLLGEGAFPDHAVILVSIWPYTKPPAPIIFHTPVTENQGAFHSHLFCIPGLDFKLALGKRMPEKLRRICSYRSPEKMIFASTKAAIKTMETLVKLVADSTPRGKLAIQYRKEA